MSDFTNKAREIHQAPEVTEDPRKPVKIPEKLPVPPSVTDSEKALPRASEKTAPLEETIPPPEKAIAQKVSDILQADGIDILFRAMTRAQQAVSKALGKQTVNDITDLIKNDKDK